MPPLQSIQASTGAYERWLAGHSPELVASDLQYKHQQMAGPTKAALKGLAKSDRQLRLKEARFSFFRGTFYRWAQLWPRLCPELSDPSVPHLVAVGDLHVENFGTWRDSEYLLIWGVNDFDEAHPMPYTCDLVRLAASALWSPVQNPEEGLAILLEGYRHGLGVGGRPIFLNSATKTLIEMSLGAIRNPPKFWKSLEATAADPQCGLKPDQVPDGVKAALGDVARGKDTRFARRRAGMGSLGRQRYFALFQTDGRPSALEAKSVAPSAWVWANSLKPDANYYNLIHSRAVRSSTPIFRVVNDTWVVRPLAPYMSKIGLAGAKIEATSELLYAMGWETANVHLGNGGGTADDILEHLRGQAKDWLLNAAERMNQQLEDDFEAWRENPEPVSS